ncbi:MAG TPA: alpha-L-fucosidase, partial [Fodinibius sp.]|nr:alpha-L-fucosidase [Fodinibius sp.]
MKRISNIKLQWIGIFLMALAGFDCTDKSKAQRGNEKPRQNYALIDSSESLDAIVAKAARLSPSQRQYEWQKLEFTAFLHFGINTFTDREWGTGKEDPALFNPTNFDADQWMRVLKDAGIKLVILTAKHHDGFCLWPSEYTEHDVASSPWRDGKGDVVKAVAEAADRAGLKFGVYLSPWDRHEPSYGQSEKYNTFFKHQLRELLTNYGKIDEVWFDGAKGDDVDQTYDWDGYYRLIRELQPEAVIAVRGPDVRWVGTESGYGRETEWSVVPGGPVDDKEKMKSGLIKPNVNATAEDLGSREQLKDARSLFWYPSEVDVSIRPGWFYHAEEDAQVKSLDKMLDIYYSSVGRNSLLLLNIPPDKRGRIHEADARRLRELRAVLEQTFDENIAKKAAVEAEGDNPQNVIDSNIETHWSPVGTSKAATLSFNFEEPKSFNRLMVQENILQGQRVEQFKLEAKVENKWRKIAEGTTIGYKRLLRFPVVTTTQVRLEIEQSRLRPAIAEVGFYKAPERLSNPVISRNKQGRVSISTASQDPQIFYTLDGSTPTPQSNRYGGSFDLAEGGTVRARAYINDLEKASEIVEQKFDIAKANWQVISVDKEVSGHEGSKAIDGDPSTMWHTPWQNDNDSHPHHITIDLGRQLKLKGFTYLPRQDGNISGTVANYRVYISSDTTGWGPAAASGSFSNIKNNP